MARNIGEFGAAVAEVTEPVELLTFKLGPDTFYIDTDLGFIPFGKFASAAVSGLDTAEMEGIAAVMSMMEDLIGEYPGTGKTKAERAATSQDKNHEWARFKRSAQVQKTKIDTLLEIIGAVFSAEAGRPTQQPSGSSNGRSRTATSAKSKQQSSSVPLEVVTDDLLKELGG